ncbi:hypothetical protein RND81_01G083000 [Saponaria officinalis]|uniref:FLZ-type domain-containing protein n=1 Tax=Saponaria officinalis TaxID=3572 RepID=A0AAW1NDL1_SAPOF
MLRKRSRSGISKQGIVGDHSNNPKLPLEKPTKPSSFFFTSPRFFKGFFGSTNKSDPMMSPTSILDTNPFSVVANFWVFDNNKISSNATTKTLSNEQHRAWEQPNNKHGIGLALIDENLETNSNNNNTNMSTNNTAETKQQKRKLVVFGSQLRIQVPSISVFPCFSPESPREFGIKTPRNNIWPFGNKELNSQVHPEESYNENDMIDIDEQSEDYTCVISHGPNPKTTHIFGNCVVQSCCGKIVGSPSISSRKNPCFSSFGNSSPSPSQVHFLSFCHHCKKQLGEGRDIYMYRGEKGFCSEECRCKEMLLDEVVEK